MKISENKGDYFRLLSSIYHYLLEPENSCKYSCILYTRAMSAVATSLILTLLNTKVATDTLHIQTIKMKYHHALFITGS